MNKEIIEMTFKKMGIKPYEKFKLKRYDATKCMDKIVYFTDELKLYYADSRLSVLGFQIIDILSGFMKIVKEPTEEDKIIINYARLCGFNWIAVDEDGEVIVSTGELERDDNPNHWNPKIDEDYEYLLGKLSFLTWEDEPYYIEKEGE